MEGASDNPALAPVAAYLGKYMRVTITDGRVIIGKFVAVDRESNIVLHAAEEWAPADVLEKETPSDATKRALGPVLVPGKHLVKAEIAEQ